MFERLDDDARAVVDTAIAAARELGHGWLGTEHVLLGALAHRTTLPAPARALLPDIDVVRRRLTGGIRSPGRPSDDALLLSLGIDAAEVRRRAAETFGTEAVRAAARRARTDRRGRRRRRCERPSCLAPVPGSELGMAPRLKRAFERARTAAERRGQPAIGPAVLLDGLLAIEDGLACELLRCLGVDVAGLRAALTV